MVSRDTLTAAHLDRQDQPPRLQASSPRYGEKIIKAVLAICAALSVATTAAIVVSLVGPALQFFETVAPFDFLFGTQWSPSFTPQSFGVLPLVAGTVSVVLWGLLAAIPLGLGAAIYLSEYAPVRVRKVIKPILEVLEGVPTVAFGFFAFSFITPLLQQLWPGFLGGGPNIFNAGAAGLAIGLLIVPIIASISHDAMSAVPQGLRSGAYAMGAGRARVSLRVVFPAALSGIVAAIVLGVSRAIGETMVVLMAAGNSPNLDITFTESIQAMTAYIGVTATGDIATGTIEYDTIFAVGLLLFVMTLAMTAISIRLVRRYRQVYE
ncbi:phosphate ABC transporter permease subunit PstC [Mycolicibacterium hippocampi]|uniref:phosphate ABC transporter permease subunit PstC n=1 Tax=Mycolicibacterium hippocampi TaxID=659824 RepID=UPI003518B4B9